VLRVDRVGKVLGDRPVLAGLSLTVAPGEKVVVLGRNGAGKSTLLKLVTGVWRPTSGRITVDGHRPAGRRGRARLGAVFQDATVDPYMTPRETLRLHGVLYGLRGRALAARVPAALARVGLAGQADRPNRTLSGGQRRRLELARCLVHDTALLVLDEPTTGLDPVARAELWAAVEELRAERALAVLFTHHAEELTGCDRVLRLRDGGLEVCGDHAFAAAFPD
jgi:ABC-2 type transport system ATP-binding protein